MMDEVHEDRGRTEDEDRPTPRRNADRRPTVVAVRDPEHGGEYRIAIDPAGTGVTVHDMPAEAAPYWYFDETGAYLVPGREDAFRQAIEANADAGGWGWRVLFPSPKPPGGWLDTLEAAAVYVRESVHEDDDFKRQIRQMLEGTAEQAKARGQAAGT